MNNQFEKQIQKKLDQFEVEPSENLFDSILESRASRSRGLFGVKVGAAILAFTTIVVVLVWNQSNDNVGIAGASAVKQQTALTEPSVEPARVIENTIAENNAKSSPTVKAESPAQKRSKPAGITKEGGLDKTGEKVSSGNLVATPNNIPGKNIANHESASSSNHQMGGEYRDNGQNIFERYFNVDASDRPAISYQEHKGTSHLLVYHSVAEERLEALGANTMRTKPVKKMPFAMDNSESSESIAYKQATQQHIITRKPLFIDVMFTPMLSLHNAAGNSEVSGNYRAMSKNNINQQFGVRLSYPIYQQWYVFAGASYLQLNTTYKGSIEHRENAVRYETVTSYINDPVRGTIPVTRIDTIQYVKSDNKQYNAENQYKIVQLPIGMSYNFGYKKFNFAIHASALFNVYAHSEGQNMDFANRQVTSYNSTKKHLGMGTGLSFMASYPLSNRFRAILEPGFQYFGINGSKNGNIVNERIFNNSLSIGLRYSLF